MCSASRPFGCVSFIKRWDLHGTYILFFDKKIVKMKKTKKKKFRERREKKICERGNLCEVRWWKKIYSRLSLLPRMMNGY